MIVNLRSLPIYSPPANYNAHNKSYIPAWLFNVIIIDLVIFRFHVSNTILFSACSYDLILYNRLRDYQYKSIRSSTYPKNVVL